MRITAPTALRRLAALASKLRPVRVVAGTYRAAPISYAVIVAHGQDTCSMDLYKTRLGPEFFTCPTGSDSAFEVHHIASFADSLFRAALSKPVQDPSDELANSLEPEIHSSPNGGAGRR
ncbi:MAG: hypothetical protein EOO62_00615, partial [Hymenobacter sp.]